MVRFGNGEGCDSRHPSSLRNEEIKLFIFYYIKSTKGPPGVSLTYRRSPPTAVDYTVGIAPRAKRICAADDASRALGFEHLGGGDNLAHVPLRMVGHVD